MSRTIGWRDNMSLVGQRAEVPDSVNMSNSAWRDALQTRPGITDPVTLRPRNEEDFMATVPRDRERFYLEILQPPSSLAIGTICDDDGSVLTSK